MCKKYFKTNSNIEVNFGDEVTFMREGEIDGLKTYFKIEGVVTPDNIAHLTAMDYVEEREVEPEKPKCNCKLGSDFDLDKTIADLEEVCKILQKYIG